MIGKTVSHYRILSKLGGGGMSIVCEFGGKRDNLEGVDSGHPMTLSPGTRLGPYEVLAQVGAGGMGEVYRARDPRLGRDVAIKVLPDPLRSSSISRHGRLLVPLASLASWFFPPGVVDLATGSVTRIPVDHFGDYHFVILAPDGQLIAGSRDLRSAIWRFQPDSH